MKNKSGKVGKWIDMEFLHNWGNYTVSDEYMKAGFMLDEIGFVHLRGTLTNSVSREESVTVLPPVYRPHRSAYGVALNDGNNLVRCYIDGYGTDKGRIHFPSAGASGGWVSIDGITWWVGKERLRQL